MRVTLVCRSFDKNSGQGIYKMAGYLYENLRKYTNLQIKKIEEKQKNPYYFDLIECPKKVLRSKSHIYHFLMPEVSLPILLSRRIREKSIVTIHDAIVYKVKERKWLSEKYIKLMYNVAKKAKYILTPSQQSKTDLINILNISESKIFVIPWGVDLNLLKPMKKKRRRPKIVGYLGGLGKRKNIEWLLYLAKEFNDFIFKIAGVGAQLRKLKEMTENFKLKNVEFVGFVPEEKLSEFYNSIDIFVFPSFYEGFGIPLLEAMACEVPYIIGTYTGIGEILPVYKIQNFAQLQELLKKIVNKDLPQLKNLRRWTIRNGFTWKEHTKKLLKLYESVAR